MLDTIPSEIHFDEENLFITWKDGFQSKFNLLYLRKNCPCATCRGGDFGKIGTMTAMIEKAELVAWRKVGRYAVNLTWKDNHDTGIFTYDKLREYSDGRSQELHSS
jgi:DUF971 family protein